MVQFNTKYPAEGYAESRIGGRSENQDTCAYVDTPLGLLVLVCDGMGGGPGGKTASMLAAKTISDTLLATKPDDDRELMILKAVKAAHKALFDAVEANPQLKGMGTTVTLLLLNEQSAMVAHVGDSRIYQFRNGHRVFRTTDHSMVMDMVKLKRINEEQARVHPQSNVITRALGHGESPVPDIEELPYLKGDRFVLCTDGIWGAMPEKELIKIIGGVSNPAGAVEEAVVKIDDIGASEGGHHDNLTIAIVNTTSNSILKIPMSPTVKKLLIALAAIAAVSVILNIVLLTRGSGKDKEKQETPVTVTAPAQIEQATIDSIIEVRMRELEAKNREQLDQIDKMLKDKKVEEATKSIGNSLENLKVLEKLDQLIAQLNKLMEMKAGKDKKAEINKTINQVKELTPQLEALKVSQADINYVVTELGKEICTRNPSEKGVKGQYTLITKRMRQIQSAIRTH